MTPESTELNEIEATQQTLDTKAFLHAIINRDNIHVPSSYTEYRKRLHFLPVRIGLRKVSHNAFLKMNTGMHIKSLV